MHFRLIMKKIWIMIINKKLLLNNNENNITQYVIATHLSDLSFLYLLTVGIFLLLNKFSET